MRHHKLIGVMAALMLLALIAVPVMAQGPKPCAFTGSVTLDGDPCPDAIITVTLEDGTPVATNPDMVEVNNDSKYAVIIPQDFTTGKPAEGDTIIFYVNGYEGGRSTWQAGGGATGVKTKNLAASTGAPGPFTLSVTISPSGKGNVNLSPTQPAAGYSAGQEVTLTASAIAGWDFDYWSGDASGHNPTVEVIMDDDKDVTAYFEREGAPPANFASWLYETFVECLID